MLTRNLGLAVFLFTALPMSHPSQDQMDQLREDVATLKDFRAQQRDWNAEEDRRVIGELHDLSKGQSTQDATISQLEGRIDTLYRFGALGGFAVGLLSPFAWSSYRRKQMRMVKLWHKLLKVAELQGFQLEDLEMEEED